MTSHRNLFIILTLTALIASTVLTGCGKDEASGSTTTSKITGSSVYGTVTSLDGYDVTLSLRASASELIKNAFSTGDDAESTSFDTVSMTPPDGMGDGENAPELPDGEAPGEMGEAPEMPDGEANGEMGEAPEMPEGEAPGEMGETPEMPNGEAGDAKANVTAEKTETSGAEETDEAADGENTGDETQEAAESSDGTALPDSDGSFPGNMEFPSGNTDMTGLFGEDTLVELGTTLVLTLKDEALIQVVTTDDDGNTTTVSGGYSDISVGSVLEIQYNEDGVIAAVLVRNDLA